MTFGMIENGELRTAQFECLEDVEMESFHGCFRVQGMRDGNVYMTEKRKKKHGRPLFREDNSSLSLGRNGYYYFVFTMPEHLITKLPKELVRQARVIAKKAEELV